MADPLPAAEEEKSEEKGGDSDDFWRRQAAQEDDAPDDPDDGADEGDDDGEEREGQAQQPPQGPALAVAAAHPRSAAIDSMAPAAASRRLLPCAALEPVVLWLARRGEPMQAGARLPKTRGIPSSSIY